MEEELKIELEDILESFTYLGGEEAISNVSFLIEDYTREKYDECLVAQAATSTMRLYSNALTVRDRLQQLYNKFQKQAI